MKSISSFGNNNQNPINDREGLTQKHNYHPSYLTGKQQNDVVSFAGHKKEGVKDKGIRGLLIALAATLGLSGCSPAINNKDANVASSSNVAITESVDGVNNKNALLDNDKVVLLNFESNVPVVSIISSVKNEGENVEVKKFPNILAMMDDKFPGEEQVNSTTHVVRTSSNEADECTNLLEAINKQYTKPFINNGGDPGEITGAVLDQIAREVIENNEDMQKQIAEHYGVENWMEADIDKVLTDDLYEMGINEFKTPDIVEIHGISTISPLYNRSESTTTLYSTKNDTIALDNSIKSVEDLYAAFASNYTDVTGKEANVTASSIATWLTIKDNQYNEAFDGKINNDGDRTDLMLLKTLGELPDGETLELKLPQTFGVNVTASGKGLEDVSIFDAYHIVHEMTPTESSFTLDASKKVMSEEDTPGIYDFVDIATMYSDPDTLEPYATKEKDENGDYVFKYNLNVADLNAKTYSLYEQFAYDHMDFFAATQTIDVDGVPKEYEFGVFDVKEGYEEVVDDLVKEGDYDSAKQYLTFNLERFVSGSFYDEDGSLKTDGDLTMSLEQYFYVNDGEGNIINVPDIPSDSDKDSDTNIDTNIDTDTDTNIDTDTDTNIDTDTNVDTDTDTNVDTDTDTNIDTDTDTNIDTDTDTNVDTDTDTSVDTDTDTNVDTDTDTNVDTDTDTNVDTDTDTNIDTDTDTNIDTDTDTNVDTDTDTNVDTDTDTNVDTDTDTNVDTDTDTNIDTDTDTNVDTDTDTNVDTDTDTNVDTDTDTSVDTDTDTNVDTDTDTNVDTDTDVTPDTDNDCPPEDDVLPDIDGGLNQNTGASDEGVQQDVDTTTSTGQLDDASNFEPGIVTNDSPVQEPQITDAAPASETTSETSQLTDEEMGGENAADLDW